MQGVKKKVKRRNLLHKASFIPDELLIPRLLRKERRLKIYAALVSSRHFDSQFDFFLSFFGYFIETLQIM
jgi:hypothetical protein